MQGSVVIEYIRAMFKNLRVSSSKNIWLLAVSLMLSACVSDTLSQVDTQPQQLAQPEKEPKYDPIQREQAIAEIRAKSAQPTSDQLTNPYVEANGPNEPFTAQEQAQKIAELQNTESQNEIATDAELEAKQRSIRELQKKAQSHYGNAVKQIKN